MKILYVEDNRHDADLTFRELNKSAPDFIMETVGTQREALRALGKKNDYDLVLADMRLPDGDGLAILTHIRGRGLLLAVVIITGQGDEETAVAALKAGAQDYVVKRDNYRDRLPLILQNALECYREASIRSSQPLRVLYAEPSSLDADLTKRHLTNYAPHISLDLVGNASEVFQFIADDRHNEHPYDALLLDYRLPGMNALEILKELRQVFGMDLPIILVTGQGGEEVAVQALKLGVTDYIVKNPGYLFKVSSVLENAIHRVQLVRDHRIAIQLKRQNELIMNSAGEGIMGLDVAGNHTFVNPAAARLLGYEIPEMVGVNGHSLWHHTKGDGSPCNEDECFLCEACREGKALRNHEDVFRRKDGTEFPVEFSLMPIRENGQLHGFVITFCDITERKRADDALRKSEERFRAVFERSTVGKSLTAPDGKLLQINKAFADMLGYTTEEIQQLNFAQITHPDDAAKGWECIRGLLTGEQTVCRFEKRYIHKSGDIVWADFSSTLLHDEQGTPLYLIASIVDITDRKRAEEQIREYSENLERMVKERTEELNRALSDSQEARDRIDGILKSVADGLIVTDLYNRVILMNRAAEDLLGVRLSDVITHSIDYAIKDKTLQERIRTTLKKREPGYQFDFELPGERGDHPRIMRARTSVIEDIERRQTGIITIIQDVTYERELDRMKTEFLSTAAHELRSPLTSIQGFSELLMSREDITDKEQIRFLSHINSQSKNLAAIISDLLDICRIESGEGFKLKKIAADLETIARDVASRFESVSAIHRFDVTFPGKPVEVMIDPEKMEQVLGNIFSNAVKYSPGGGVINVVGETVGDDLRISVEDEGIGMTPEQVEKIYDKFYRADSSNTVISGTGLGMSIVKHIVESHEGTVSVASEFGKGTTVTFTIPLNVNNGERKS